MDKFIQQNLKQLFKQIHAYSDIMQNYYKEQQRFVTLLQQVVPLMEQAVSYDLTNSGSIQLKVILNNCINQVDNENDRIRLATMIKFASFDGQLEASRRYCDE